MVSGLQGVVGKRVEDGGREETGGGEGGAQKGKGWVAGEVFGYFYIQAPFLFDFMIPSCDVTG